MTEIKIVVDFGSRKRLAVSLSFASQNASTATADARYSNVIKTIAFLLLHILSINTFRILKYICFILISKLFPEIFFPAEMFTLNTYVMFLQY